MASFSTVWLVDDSALERQSAARVLSSQHELEVFHDGPAVVERLASGVRPDVLVLDWVMPGMSGLEVCRFVRGLSDGEELPILMLTSQRETENIVEGLAAGANDFVAKPFIGAELLARVGSLVRAKLMRDESRRLEVTRTREAEERSRLSELYMGIIGHDLRNPLGAIMTAATLLGRPDYPEEKRRLVVERILRSAHRMNEMIGQILDVTRTRLGTGLEVRPSAIDVHQVCREVASELELTYPGRAVKVEPHGQGSAIADRSRLAQAVSNLVANALQHGDKAEPVVIRAGNEGSDMVVEVHNEGPPIPPALISVLFDPFRRAMANQGHSSGLGLGLYITDQIVKAHGGSIGVRSSKGTTFEIRLPSLGI